MTPVSGEKLMSALRDAEVCKHVTVDNEMLGPEPGSSPTENSQGTEGDVGASIIEDTGGVLGIDRKTAGVERH